MTTPSVVSDVSSELCTQTMSVGPVRERTTETRPDQAV